MNAIGKLGCIIVIVNLCLCKIALSQQEVEVPDPNLRSALREALSLSSNQPITQAHLRTLVHLDAIGMGITDLTGLEYATNLTMLNLSYNEIISVNPLRALTKLEWLWIKGNPGITDIGSLQSLTNITHIFGDACRITSLSPLRNMTKLVLVSMPYNGHIESVAPLSNNTHLEELWLAGNNISDVRVVRQPNQTKET